MKELPPPSFDAEAKSMELLRLWLADGSPTFVITPDLWDDPATWGLLLADLMRHVANAYSANGHEFDQVVSIIKSAFDAEWGHPTSSADSI